MLSSPALAAILRHLADEVEKPDAPPAPPPAPPAPDPFPAQPIPANVQPLVQPIPTNAPPPAAPKPMIDLTTVKGVQQAYNQLRAANFPKLEENGVHDAVMSFALKMFQAAVGIPVTGDIDEITRNTLHKAIFGAPRT